MADGSQFEHHATFWLEDGNVILIAENMGFRVHRTILSMHSAFFRDMFSLPQPQTQDSFVEGCPDVRMVGDTPEDIALMLQVMYYGEDFYKDSIVLPFSTVASALRIGTKFQIDSMRKEALARLSVCFPSSLQAFHNGVSLVPTHDVPHAAHRSIALERGHAITVFHLARTFGLDELVPAAIYTCAQLSTDDLFRACQAGSLTFSELEECIRERQTLQNECLLKSLIFIKGELSPDCACSEQSDVTRCAEDMKGLAEASVGLQACRSDSAPDALMPVLDEWVVDETLCDACQAYVTARHEQERQQIWDRLWKKYVSATARQN